jgi:branched-chain amino acid transport system substrate-binding protein
LCATATFGAGPFRINLARADSGTIPIGFPVPLTGPYALEAQDQVRCAELAVDQFNSEGGLNGRRAELLVRDDMLNPGTAAAMTRILVRRDQAKLIVGSLSATVQLSVASTAAAEGAVYVSISQSDAIADVANGGPLIFHEALTPHMTCQAVGHYVFPRHGPRVAYLVADYTYGHETARGMQRVGDGYQAETVAEIRHPIATNDFSPFLPKIMEAQPDILCLCNFGRDQLYSIRDATQMGLKKNMRLVAPALLYHQRMTGGAAIFEDVVGGSNYHWTLEDSVPSAKQFNDAYRARYDKPPSDYGAYGYGGVKALLMAIKRADSTEPHAVADALRTLKYDHYKGQQWFRACDGQSVQSVFVVGSKAESKMANAHDVFEILETQSAEEIFMRSCTELGY